MRIFFAILLGSVSLLVSGQATDAAPIVIGSTTFELGNDAFPNLVEQIAGSTSSFGGITAEEGLTGPDIDTGAFNLNEDDVFELMFPVPIVNQVGDDIYFTDSRFSSDALDFSLDGGATFQRIQADDFVDPGVDSVIRNAGQAFDLFAATIDMSNFGFAPGASITSLQIRGTGQSDPIVVGNLNSAVIPEPSTLVASSIGAIMLLAGLGVARRRKDHRFNNLPQSNAL